MEEKEVTLSEEEEEMVDGGDPEHSGTCTIVTVPNADPSM